jgi:tetratricopeptide (TPR) repeat protein
LDRLDEATRLNARMQVYITQLVARHPDIPEFRIGLAWNEFELGNLLYLAGRQIESSEHFRMAIDTAGQLVEQFPNEPRHQNHLSGMLATCPALQFRDGKRAAAASRRAMQLNGNPGEWRNLAVAQLADGQWEEALQSFAKYRETRATDGTVHLGEALAYGHLGRFDEARKSYQLALDWLQSTPNRYWYRAELRLVRKEFEELLKQHQDKPKAATGDANN